MTEIVKTVQKRQYVADDGSVSMIRIHVGSMRKRQGEMKSSLW